VDENYPECFSDRSFMSENDLEYIKQEDIKKKFDKLVLFYTKGINPNNLNLYKTINLKFDNQIVCKKNQ